MQDIGMFFMDFGDFLIWLGLAWLAFTVTVAVLEALLMVWVRRRMSDELTAVGLALDEERLIALTVEVDQNQYFCYNSITKDFVCQGRDLKEIRERFRERYPDKDAAIYDGDKTAVATLKSQLKELKAKNENSIGI
jgi:hypothetical protein